MNIFFLEIQVSKLTKLTVEDKNEESTLSFFQTWIDILVWVKIRHAWRFGHSRTMCSSILYDEVRHIYPML